MLGLMTNSEATIDVTTKRIRLPDDLVAAIEGGEITQEQLRQLIRIEAAELGLSYEEAVELGRKRALPKSIIGMDIEGPVMLLDE
jgi:hypothetical protein